MKKILLNAIGILFLTFTFLATKANLHPGGDSTIPGPVSLYSSGIHRSMAHHSAKQFKENSAGEVKKFIFSATVTPWFEATIPPVNLYFEHGIAGLASAGLSLGAVYDSQSEYDYHSATISLGVRGCGYAMPIISKIAGKEINNFGFQPYLGVVYDYYVTASSIGDTEIDPANFIEFGVVAGTRWYPGKGKFALMGEYNSNGIGSNIRFGISLGR